jgi:pantoate--beta-alanine ligase
MKIVKDINQASLLIKEIKNKSLSLGLVPTMGNLHQGHLSLVERAKKENDLCAVSIFINPTQFGAGEDFNKYPRTLEDDLKKLSDFEVDIIFVPEIEDIYTDVDNVFIDESKKTKFLCGKFRPGHFKGVLTIVLKLFNIFRPERAYFGSKDYQQYLLIKDMITSLNFDVDIIPCPIIREKDGLAMSSRNVYLSPEQRLRSLSINSSLNRIKTSFEKGNSSVKNFKAIALGELQKNNLELQYVEVVNSDSLESLEIASKGDLVAIAAFCDQIRLIDNLIL